MSENPLVLTLSQSVQAQSFSESIKHLWSAQHLLSSPGASSLLNLKVTTLLNRLLSKYSSQIFLPLSRVYLDICKILETAQSSFLIKLANDVLLICEEIKGAEIADELLQALQDLFDKLIKMGLDPEQLEVVHGLKTVKNLERFNSEIMSVSQKIKQGQVWGAHELFDVFSGFDKFSDQVDLFVEKMQGVNEAFSSTNNVEIIKKALTLLEHFIFKFNYSVQIGEFTEIYTVNLSQKLPVSLIPNTVSVINTILPYENSVIQYLLPIIQRLWALFPQECQSFFDSTRMLLSSISLQGSIDYKSKASVFLYEILNSPTIPQNLKTILEESEDFSALRNSEAFGPSSGILESEQVTKLEDLQPVVGMPMSAKIVAGGEYNYCIEIKEANSILSWGFATKDYDINFELKRIDLPTPQSIVRQDYIQCSELPYVQSRLINSPGLYQFTWSNKYSWFTEKLVRFRIVILSPYHKTNMNEKDIHKVIDVICNDDVPSNAKDILEIGIVCKSKSVKIHALGNSEELPDLDVNAIGGFITRTTGSQKFSSTKIGIISKQPKKRNELKNLKSVFMSRDVDAIALLNESEIHSDTLICVMIEEGLRSSVVHRGKILIGNDGRPIGDLFRAGITDIFVGISTLLSLFGPAHVIICGSEAPALSSILERTKDLVSEEILRESLIRTSVYGPEASQTAACKLHYLNHKYRLNH